MKILSVDGGGFLGLATATFVAGIEAHFDKLLHDTFDFFCGTSTGAIIALGLASGLSGAKLVELYQQLGSSVFRRRGRGIFTAKYDDAPLARALERAFDDRTLDDLSNDGKHALITAFCVTAGRPRLFKTDHSPNLSAHGRYRLCDVALASAAAPTFFPMVTLKNPDNGVSEVFCDGGVVANHPALLGFAEALYEFQVAPNEISVLSLSTPREDLSEQVVGKNLKRGLFHWRKTLANILIDSNATTAHEILKRLVASYGAAGPRYERIEMANVQRIAMDDATASAVNTLSQTGVDLAASSDTRHRLRTFFF